MSAKTLEEIRDRLRDAGDYHGTPVSGSTADAMADIIDAILRERESAKAAVTDEMLHIALAAYNKALFAGSYGPDDGKVPSLDYPQAMHVALEAVAPMLASARVPDELKSAPASPLHPLWGDGYLRGWNACRAVMLAVAPKPETHAPQVRPAGEARVPEEIDNRILNAFVVIGQWAGPKLTHAINQALVAAPKPETEE